MGSASDTFDAEHAIAVIGMQLRYPGASTVREFWRNLRDGLESISFYTEEELVAAGISRETIRAPGFVAANPQIGDVTGFEPAFFGFTPREAEVIDPQVRILLETSWQALEDAGYDPDRYRGKIGVFTGANLSRYFIHNLMPQAEHLTAGLGSISAISMFNDRDALATIVSYKLNLKGPGVTVQTYCSTSLVAVHLGCQSILTGDSDMVLAGGVSLNGETAAGYQYEEGSIVSRDGHCRTFDAQASGTVFGNGAGMVVLKRLDRAVADGDSIHAVIRGSSINNDGAFKGGFLAPSVQGQVESITAALERSGVNPETIGLVEAHGTATLVGDPIEVSALSKAFSLWTDRRQYCVIGSVKANFGHLDRAAGVAGLMKTVLAVKEGTIPPTINYSAPNPKIDFGNSPFYVTTKLSSWARDGGPRRALVASLGVGGTNAHAIIEEAPQQPPSSPSRAFQLIVLSARTAKSLEATVEALAGELRQRPALNLADAAFTLALGRKAFGHRRFAVGADANEAIECLVGAKASSAHANAQAPSKRPVAFLFPGQGAQYVDMGRGLYETETVFRDEVDLASQTLLPHLGFDLREALYPADKGALKAAGEKLKRTSLAQPALFVVEYALAKLWMSWGIRPDAMIGHSIGEYVAATLAGVFEPKDALHLVAARGRLMDGMPAGSMLAVPLDEAEARSVLGERLSLAAANGPRSCVVSGPADAIDELERALFVREIAARRLQTSHSFHSAMMDPILPEFTALVAQVPRHAPRIPYLSNLTGKWIEASQATSPDYWARHLRETVRFSDGAGLLLADGARVALEVGPGRTLSALAWQRPDVAAHGSPVTSLRHPQEEVPDAQVILNALGRLWIAGAEIDWEGFYAQERRRRVPLPKYTFDRQRYWVQRPAAAGSAAAQWRRQADVADWFYVPSWTPAPAAAAAAGPPRCWLILDDPGPGRDALESRLREAGHDTAIAESSPGFEKFGIGQYRLNPGKKEDFAALVDALRGEGKFPQRIVHAWAAAPGGGSLDEFDRTQDRCFYSLLFLAQALGRDSLAEPIYLAVVTRGLQSVAGEAVAAPERATLVGPCKVIAQEYRELFSCALDAAGSLEEQAAAVVSELSSPPKDPVVAWRGNARYVQRFEPRRIEASGTPIALKAGGAYLITGGLGGIGLKVAEWLARVAKARLVLINRSPLPPRSEWAAWLESRGADDRTSRRIRCVQGLEELGAQVLLAHADSSKLDEVRAAVAEARARFGRIDGVMHAAGVAGDGVIQLKERAVAAAVIDAKVRGALVMAEALRDDPPDFVVHFSSLAAVIGGFGQVDYCGANSGLDAIARAAAAAGGPPNFSINWDAWAEVGMAVETAVRPKLAQMFKQASEFKPIEHPVFNRVRMEGEEIHYVGELSAERSWIVSDHVLFGKPTLPGTAYLELARSAFARHAGAGPYEFRNVFILAVFPVEPGQTREIHVLLNRADDGYDFVIKSPAPHDPENWLEHCRGHISAGTAKPAGRHDFTALAARCTAEHHEVNAPSHAAPGLIVRQAAHLSVGPRWMTPEWVKMGVDEGVSKQRLADAFVDDLRDFPLHPGLLDLTAFYPIKSKNKGVYIPFSHGVVRVYRDLPPQLNAHVRVTDDGKSGSIRLDLMLLDDAGNEVLVMEEYVLKQIESRDAKGSAGGNQVERFPFLPGAENFQVNMEALGQLDTLALVASERRAPGPGEIELQVHAAGLNFKDVLRGLGMLSSEHDAGLAVGFGGECTGQVIRVGEGVLDFKPGDRVIAMGSKCFGGFLTTSALAAAPLPDNISYLEGATIPTVFLTAHYALHQQGRLQKGEKILVHAAAGGVGLAAVQCARRVGAEVLATAGSAPKRDYLHSIGVEHVFDSRSLGFAEDVMRVTEGRGVDVVLNSLAGEFIPKGLSVLGPLGRFLEIGARDIYQNSQIGLRPFARNLSFIAIELSPVMQSRPRFIRDMLDEIMGHFRSGAFKPLPSEVFPITEVAGAFQRMASAKHIGKVLLSVTPPARPVLTGPRNRTRDAAVRAAAGAAAKGGAHEAAIVPAEGIEALARILSAGLAQVAVSSRPLQPIIDFLRGQKEAEPASAKPAARKLYPRPALANPYLPPGTETEKVLAKIWQDLIGIEQVGAQDNFFELGGDSLIGVQVLSRIKKEFGVQLAPASLYEGPTLDRFAQVIDAGREAPGGAEPLAAKEAGK